MDFGSIRRKNRVSQPSQRRNKTFSSSNLSCISCNSTSVARKTVYVTLPKDFGCEVNLDGKIVQLRKKGPAHGSGVLQIGDYLRMVDDSGDDTRSNSTYGFEMERLDGLVKLQVTYGILQVDSRPNCPLVIEIGNRSNTSLGIALTDYNDQIQISSIQPGSLAERCGFLQPGDCLTSIYISADETIPCSPFYNSYQIAQILRQLATKNPSIKLTIIPSAPNPHLQPLSPNFLPHFTDDIDVHSGGSDSTLTLGESDSSTSNYVDKCGSRSFGFSNRTFRNIMLNESLRQIEKVDELEEVDNSSNVLSFCLWKDPLYEDWGFSLVDDSVDEDDVNSQSTVNSKLLEQGSNEISRYSQEKGAIVYQIRPGGPACNAGLKSNDRIIQINGRDVSHDGPTMLVPILASLENALNLLILRNPNNSDVG